jgi:two-component system chemotaxis sensor kinase CheA
MPISPDSFSAIEEVLNRLTVEAVLAAPGRDESLVPIYSLLGEIRTLCAAQPAVVAPIDALLPEFERCLEAASSLSAPLVGRLRMLVEWLPSALEAWQNDLAVIPSLPAAPAESAGSALSSDLPEALLALDLAEESRELLTEFYGEALEHLQQIEAALLTLERSSDDREALNSIFRSFHTIKGNAGFLGLEPMNLLAHEVESLLDLARNRRLRLNSAIITEILCSRDALQALIDQVGRALKTGQVPDRVVPIRHLIESMRQLAVGSAELVGEILPAGPGESAAADGIAPAAAAGEGPAAPDAAERGAEASRTVRVSTEKLDSLMDVVGELVIVQSQLLETAHRVGAADPSLQRDVAQLNRIAKELQRTAMALRMIPIKPAFQKMERLARDLACASGKKIDFTTSGEGTRVDRTVVEEIGDPLVHMVRNALDHGLELPAERLAEGKTETGSVRLRAYHEGGSVIVELKDDGRGIDPVKVLAKARRLGLVASDVQLDRAEIFGLIFLPGFSTAEKITSMSGRGVGMDVVKRNIERLRGKIEVDSEVGRGTVFKIKLPLTLAIIDGLVVRVGDDRFILPSTSVQMALRPVRKDVVRVQGCGEVLDWHGRLLPLHRLHRHFGIPARAKEPWDGIVVIVEASGKLCALLVDEMISKQEVVIKSLGAFLQGLAGVSGVAILGDGSIALILDPATLLQAA